MAQISNFTPNNFCWLDYAGNEMKSANEFFTKLFGWDISMADGSPMEYFMINHKGMPGGGTMALSQEMKDMNVPPCWTSYIGVENIEACLAKTTENGGKVMFGAMEVPGAGRWAIIQDTEDGVVGLWEPTNLKGFAHKDEHGAPCWFEFASNNPESTSQFYVNVFGWTCKKEDMGGMEYFTFNNGNESVAGMFKMPPELQDVPPHWLPYFGVDSIDKAIDTINVSNGLVLMPKTYVQGIGYFGVYKDPQGGAFGLVEAA
jgi:predicted enzyme related to lactoylglutathione lyase